MTSEERNRAARLRLKALRQDYQLKKSCVRDPDAFEYGTYRLVDITGKRPDPTRSRMTLDEVENYLVRH